MGFSVPPDDAALTAYIDEFLRGEDGDNTFSSLLFNRQWNLCQVRRIGAGHLPLNQCTYMMMVAMDSNTAARILVTTVGRMNEASPAKVNTAVRRALKRIKRRRQRRAARCLAPLQPSDCASATSSSPLTKPPATSPPDAAEDLAEE